MVEHFEKSSVKYFSQGETLSDGHVSGLAGLLLHMGALGKRLPHVKLQTHRGEHRRQEAEPDQMSLLNLICKTMQHRTDDSMEFSLRLARRIDTL